ncbi:serine/threonine-protein kinase [Actinomadura sp. ATCC 31491]|uniref:Serine/threonine-protein kinase n=1 Tax=Actinomadura luzonensis TaxID=2805427 RepID=A0ABT0G5P4_9ACTN|nr:serine/threonine-protein kinase [Actinomadura luzonensis]MCK2219941.1 serine/threonine-protein kinase [Actinomadura luzonensis]
MGRYWLAGRLGAGGQGVVYEAYGEEGERVAVKVPRFDGPEARARLAREAAAARRVASFCTARVIEAQVDAAPLFIVSEYVPGPSLRQVVAGAGPYDAGALRRLAIGVATALTAIHQAGVVHRDLKPDNIILSPDGPRVIDFGVAREAGPTTTGPALGTPAYMAPEVLTGHAATPAADVWAWAMVVLFAARGRDAIEAGEPMAVAGRVLGFAPGPGELRDELPDGLAPLVAAALAADPAARPAARDLLLRLLGDAPSGDPLAQGGALAGSLSGDGAPALGTVAEELYAELSEPERASAPEVFLRMLDGDTLRPVRRDELPESADVAGLLAVFTAAGLLTRRGDGYELAAPGLVQAWPRLRDWAAANRDGLPVHRRLAEAAAEWDRHGRRPADLPQGAVLDRTLQWAAAERKDLTLARRERDFLDAAARQARRRGRRRNLVAAALAVLLVAALGGLGAAEYLRRETGRQRDDALARELALRADGLRELEPVLARLLSVAAWRLDPALPETRGALADAASQAMIDAFTAPYVNSQSVQALSQDGRTLASADAGTARVWDVATRRPLHELSGLPADVERLAVTGDGRLLATLDPEGVRLWDTATGRPAGGRFAREAYAGVLGRLDFDPAGRLLTVPEGAASQRWYDLATRRRLDAPSGAGLDAISADGRYGFVSEGSGEQAELWDLTRRRRLPAPWLPGRGVSVQAAFSADGTTLAVVEDVPRHDKPKIHVYDLATGDTILNDEGGPGQTVAFTPGDRFVALHAVNTLLTLWGRGSRRIEWRRELLHTVDQVRFDPDGRTVRVLGEGIVKTIDVSVLSDRPLAGGDARVLPDPSARVVAVKRPGTLELLDAATGRRLAAPLTWPGEDEVMAFSPDGTRLAAAAGKSVRVVDARSGQVLSSFGLVTKGATEVYAAAFGPGGHTLALSVMDDDSQDRLELRDLDHATSTATSLPATGLLGFRPDGRLLVGETAPHLVDPARLTTLPGDPESLRLDGSSAFSPDGRQVVFTGPDRLSLWTGDLTRRLATFALVPYLDARLVAWSPDGRVIATYEGGERVRLWDAATRRPMGVVFDGQGDPTASGTPWLGFSADGRTLHSLAEDGTLRTHDLSEPRMAATACERAGRTLTPGEWARHLPGVTPFDVCP